MGPGHCFGVLRSRMKGVGEGSSLQEPSAYTPLARPRHRAIPVYKRWLRDVVLMYAVGHGALERIRTDTGVDYRRQSSPKADPALGVRSPCPGHVQWHHCLDQGLMNSQASQYSCWSVDYCATHHFKHWKLWNLCSNNTSYGNPLSYAWTHISLLKSEVGSL